MKMRKTLGKGGFTLVEIMIVVAIIGLLAAIAIPNFVKARENAQKNACVANLKQIEGAKVLWALDGGSGTPALGTDLVDDYIKKEPHCPAESTASYTANDLDTDPGCGYASAAAKGHYLTAPSS
ncbi:MAG: prepilin-type N-terminal cleavage/methylation domain-containing protein [Candidatus Omnitrophica bacterium]|nr:prepilin-type N-terminal cleavage/methylation domain-containing protein [Candidatus Omnitrophota bacterium]